MTDTHPTHPTESWSVGDLRVTRVAEMEVSIPAELLLPAASGSLVLTHRAALGPHATDDGRLTFSIHGFVVDTGDRRILVDGGVGNAKRRPSPFFDRLDTRALDALAAAGYPPDTIDTVLATHLHLDHVGWFTRLVDDTWVATFPHARHLLVAAEHAYWQGHPDIPGDGDHMADSVAPLEDAGLVDLVAPDHEVAPGVRLLPTPGHSPGHVSVLLESGAASAVITGDLLHHPLQVLRPDLAPGLDEDADEATATRRAFCERFAGTGTLVLGSHFATPAGVVLVGEGDGWGYTT